MKRITVVGAGYVGLVTGTCMADLGNCIVCLDIDAERIEKLRQGTMPIYEPGLEETVRRNVKSGRLYYATDYDEAINGNGEFGPADFIFIAVGTPSAVDGAADLEYVRAAAESIAEVMDHPLIIVNKSTVPVGTGDWVADIIRANQPQPIEFSVVSNPEFLREGSAMTDFMHPDRVVLGSVDREAAEKVAQLHLPLRTIPMITNLRTAEMIKYASNAFLATKISFINEIANICEELGADVKEVAVGMGYDQRIGHAFLDAGLGYGGSCFPKDVLALAHMAEEKGRHPQLLQAVMDINADQRKSIIRKVHELLGDDLKDKMIGLLGLAFKPNTDDMRDAPSIDIANWLTEKGAKVKAYDPVSMTAASAFMPSDVKFAEDPYELAAGCDAVILVTEWNEFKQLDLGRIKKSMNQPMWIDGRNLYDPKHMHQLGFKYRGMGHGYDSSS